MCLCVRSVYRINLEAFLLLVRIAVLLFSNPRQTQPAVFHSFTAVSNFPHRTGKLLPKKRASFREIGRNFRPHLSAAAFRVNPRFLSQNEKILVSPGIVVRMDAGGRDCQRQYKANTSSNQEGGGKGMQNLARYITSIKLQALYQPFPINFSAKGRQSFFPFLQRRRPHIAELSTCIPIFRHWRTVLFHVLPSL